MVDYAEKQFARRLNICLDREGWPVRGRTQMLLSELRRQGIRISYQGCRKWLNGEAIPKTDRLETVAQIANTSVEHLLAGKEAGVEVVREDKARYAQSISTVPLISNEQAANWGSLCKGIRPENAIRWIPVAGTRSRYPFAMAAQGDSMSPQVPQGTIVVVEPDETPKHGDFVVAKLPGELQATFKRLVIDGKKHYLEPLNIRYTPTEIDESCEIIGVAKQAILTFE